MSTEEPRDTRSGIYSLDADQRRALALALLARTRREHDGRAALRRKYPHAPEEMISTAAHHLYLDGPAAVIDFLADAELALREPAHEIDYGPSSAVLYHVYNWLQFRALLPEGKPGMLELLGEMEGFVRENDQAALLHAIGQLREMLDGDVAPPEIR